MRARTFVFMAIGLTVLIGVVSFLSSCSDDPTAPAETAPTTFSRMIGGSGNDVAFDAVATSDGLRVVAGFFADSLRVSGVSGTLVSAGSYDAFLAAFNPDGSLAWRRRHGGDGSEYLFAIARDGSDNLYVSGVYSNDTVFDGIPLTGFGAQDALAAKLDANGNAVWVIGGGDDARDEASDITPAGDGGAYVCGFLEGTMPFGGGAVGDGGSTSGFLVRLSTVGGHVWSRLAAGPSAAKFTALARTSDGGVLACGDYISGDVIVGGTTLTSNGGNDGFIVKYSDLGAGSNVIRVGGAGTCEPRGMVAIDDEPVVAGTINGTVDFDLFTTAGEVIAQQYDVFVVRYHDNGSIRWLRTLGGAGAEYGMAISRIGSNDVLVCGLFTGTVSFDSHTVTTNGVADLFVIRLDSDGDVVSASALGSAGEDVLAGVTAAGESAIVVGATVGDTRFPDGTIRNAFGSIDGFVFQR